ncbi:hypothetical protein chiPu_0003063 [Chiloscyllium punctatum]|uniref:Uncharacterized protein n=1 Tax=Chiloscyllium punctatum TaxID=137246 RepID=A0A401S2N6_CHIPU|nr:hypothetical protein [Chiloscyllium punctatum]
MYKNDIKYHDDKPSAVCEGLIEQNCVLEIIWLALFPTICIVLLIVISYQLLKEDSSCNGVKSRQREAATNINEIQQEGGRSQSHVYEACPREHQFISSDQGENARQHEAAVYISEIKQEGRRMRSPVGACSREYQYIDSVLGYRVKTLPPNNSKGQNSENVSADEYANVDSATNRALSTPRHLLGANKRQHERPLYINEIQQEGSRKQPSGHEACSRENQHVEPIIVYQGTYDSVHIYGNIEERGSVAASRHEYANVLDLAGNEAFLTSQHLPGIFN